MSADLSSEDLRRLGTAVRIADRIQNARTVVQGVWKESWREKIADPIAGLRRIMTAKSVSCVDAVHLVAKQMQQDGCLDGLVFYLAACAEICDADGATATPSRTPSAGPRLR